MYGHIHRPFVRRCGPLTVANSGSVALPWDGDARASYVLVDDGATSVRRVEYDLEASARDARDSGFPRADWLAGLIASARFVRP